MCRGTTRGLAITPTHDTMLPAMLNLREENTVLDCLFNRAEESPDALAFCIAGEEITFRNLRDRALEMAGGFRRAGVAKGDRVGLPMPNGAALIYTFFGLQLLRAIPQIVNPGFPPHTLMARFKQTETGFVLGSEEVLAGLRAETHEYPITFLTPDDLKDASSFVLAAEEFPTGDDVSHFQFTSGTSGEPRAAILLHRNVLENNKAMNDAFHFKPPDDSLVCWVPFYHDLGLIFFLLYPVQLGICSHVMEATVRNFRPWLETISRVRATCSGGPDFSYRIAGRLVNAEGLDLSSLRYSINGGEPVRKGTIEEFEKKFGLKNIIQPCYGMAEMAVGVSTMRPGTPLHADAEGNVCCGPPYKGIEVRVVDEEGRDLPPNGVGELVIRSPSMFAGYYNDPEATANSIRDGWFYSGDLGKLDEEGRLYIMGRKRAMIKRSGSLIAPREIEEAVEQIPEIRLSAAVGFVRDESLGTEEIAVIAEVKPEDANSTEARARLIDAIAIAAKGAVAVAPGDVLLVPPRTIARTGSGKIRHFEMKNRYARGEIQAVAFK